ncbi:hypothetical protein TNCV_2275061 [Trichonephila clavipes]|nr:hypothetical protein TNCV_2275061 [Trichonephila clavipes]
MAGERWIWPWRLSALAPDHAEPFLCGLFLHEGNMKSLVYKHRNARAGTGTFTHVGATEEIRNSNVIRQSFDAHEAKM